MSGESNFPLSELTGLDLFNFWSFSLLPDIFCFPSDSSPLEAPSPLDPLELSLFPLSSLLFSPLSSDDLSFLSSLLLSSDDLSSDFFFAFFPYFLS